MTIFENQDFQIGVCFESKIIKFSEIKQISSFKEWKN